MNAYQAAMALADEMVPVFPCKADKTPACARGHLAATVIPFEVWWNGAPLVGMPTGAKSGWDILDLDPRHGGDAWYEANRHRIPATRVQRTPSGGWHVYFKARPGLRCSVGLIAPGVDVRAEGGYIIRWCAAGLPVDDAPVADWPDWLLIDLARGTAASKDASAGGDHTTLAAPSVAAVVGLLDRMPNPEAAGRDTYVRVMLAAVGTIRGLDAAGRLGEHGQADIRDAALGWASRWEGGTDDGAEADKWDEDWSHRDTPLAGWPTLQAVAGQLIPGYRAEVALAEFGAAPLPVEVPAPPARRRVIAPGECEGITSRPYRVKGLLAERDVGCLFGPPGAGKSLLAPLMAYRLSQGEPFFGLRTRPGPTLYVAAEDESGMERRVSALRLAHGDAPGFGLVKGVADLLNPSSGDLAWLLAEVAERKPALIVIDTLAMAFPGLIENDADGMGRVVAVARQLTEHGAAVLLIHHDSKARDGTPRGHSLLNGALDVAIALEPKDGDGVVRARLTKNRNGSCEHDMAFRIGVRVLGTDEDGDPVTAAVAVELSGRDAAVQPPAKLSGGQERALGALVRCMATDAATAEDGAPAVPEDAWMAACIPLSPAATPKDRARSARRMRGELVEKGAVRAVGAMFRPATPARGASHGGTEGGRLQTTDFIEGDEVGRKGDGGTPSPGDEGTDGTGSYRTRPPVPHRTPLADFKAVADLVGVAS